MKYTLADLIDIEQFQHLQDRLNAIYSFPSAIIDNEGVILTATAWQDVCTKFHRRNPECERECRKSDRYILDHLHEANPAVSYRCPHGLVDNATPIIIEGIHYGNFFTGQFFLEPPDLDFFARQAHRYGFDEAAYLDAVRSVPIWTQDQLEHYLYFIKGLIEIITESGLKKLREIEARKKIEASEARADAVIQKMLDGFWMVAVDSGRILDVNGSMCAMLGYTREELLALSVSDIDAFDDTDTVARRMEKIAREGSGLFESRFRKKDGSLIDVDISVTYIRDQDLFFGFHHDNTARKAAETSLRESEDRYRTLFDQSPDGIVILDPATARPLEFNEQVCRQLGYSREEFARLSLADVEIIESLEESLNHIQKIIKTGHDEFETRQQTKQGEIRDVLVIAQVIRSGDTSIFHCIWRDITDRKRVDDQLKRSLAEKDTLLRELYHRTKNNMNVIGAMLDLQAAYSGVPAVEAMARDTERRIRAMSLVHQMLYQSKDLSHVSLKKYVHELLALLLQGYSTDMRRINLELDVEDIEAVIDTAIPCGLILNELVSNSFKHAFPGERPGSVRIRLARVDPLTMELVFSDDGVGVTQEFDYRRQNSLGFQTILSLAEHQLQGHVSFENEGGVTWRIRFSDQLYSARV